MSFSMDLPQYLQKVGRFKLNKFRRRRLQFDEHIFSGLKNKMEKNTSCRFFVQELKTLLNKTRQKGYEARWLDRWRNLGTDLERT